MLESATAPLILTLCTGDSSGVKPSNFDKSFVDLFKQPHIFDKTNDACIDKSSTLPSAGLDNIHDSQSVSTGAGRQF